MYVCSYVVYVFLYMLYFSIAMSGCHFQRFYENEPPHHIIFEGMYWTFAPDRWEDPIGVRLCICMFVVYVVSN